MAILVDIDFWTEIRYIDNGEILVVVVSKLGLHACQTPLFLIVKFYLFLTWVSIGWYWIRIVFVLSNSVLGTLRTSIWLLGLEKQVFGVLEVLLAHWASLEFQIQLLGFLEYREIFVGIWLEVGHLQLVDTLNIFILFVHFDLIINLCMI